MSLSLVAVFIPLLLMSGIVGRLFREFAVTMAAAIVISMVDLADRHADDVRASPQGRGASRPACTQWSERVFDALVDAYGRTLDVVLRFALVTLLVLIGTIALDRLPLRSRAERLFPAAGHRTPRRIAFRPTRTARSSR